MKIATGLHQSYKNFQVLTLDETLVALKTRTNLYEVLNDEHNRIYGDVDGKVQDSITEEEFNRLNEQTRTELETFLNGEQYALYTASSFAFKKISFGFVIKNKKATKSDNKKWIQHIAKELHLPDGVALDTGVYGKNQKIRCLGSSKDNEARPKVLLRGEPVDTLISHCEDCELQEVPVEKAPAKKKSAKQTAKPENPLIQNILDALNITRLQEYETWLKIGIICFNEDCDVSVWDNASQRALNYSPTECDKKWKTFIKGTLGIATLWQWLKEDNPTAYDELKQDDYQYRKQEFELTHFKLNDPSCYVRLYDGKLQFKKKDEFAHIHQNLFYNNKLFIGDWIRDPKIRTYEKVVFKPKQSVPDDCFNMFTEFPCEAVEGNIDVMKDLMWLLSGKNAEVLEYIENYFAHLIQKPYEKPGVCLVFSTSRQGAGKDTPLNFIGKIIGSEYFFNTEQPEESVFGRFTGHLQKTLLLKMEECEFETNKRNESALLSLITAPTRSFEAKGRDPIMLDCYKRIVMTTNKSTPVNIPESDRRFMLVNSSEDRVGDHEYWNKVNAELAKPETAQAYFHYLCNKDISTFNVRNRVKTDFYEEVKKTLKPYHAVFFQRWISLHEDSKPSCELKAREWVASMSETSKFPISDTRFGRDIKVYPQTAFEKKKGTYANTYTLHTKEMHEFLISKGWWDDI